MSEIVFIDCEVYHDSGGIEDFGCVKNDGNTLHTQSISEFIKFISSSKYLCGHNILNHDLVFLKKCREYSQINQAYIIDTLYLSPLLFPQKPYHSLVKDDKLHDDQANNPLNDAIKAKDLFFDEISAFNILSDNIQQIFYLLLKDQEEFGEFFNYISYSCDDISIVDLIRKNVPICENFVLTNVIKQSPIELAYCLALINANSRYSITPPWVLRNYPQVERLMFALRNTPCLIGCMYCNQALDIHLKLHEYFGFTEYRSYDGEKLQENAVNAAVHNRSLLAVFPTGGGKSITFQVPALMSGENCKALTVVISPLQSLMKDQVDNLEKQNITQAVTINGLLDPIERANSIARVEDGSAWILYISPESLRSKTIEKILLARNIARFVIDEAHCFSAWGQDFRVDYLYIGEFIANLQKTKGREQTIPVSCFTATAKQNVIEDICAYFQQKLGLELAIFPSKARRTNLHYRVFEQTDEAAKYSTVRDLIIENNTPTIIYVSRIRRAKEIAENLCKDGFNARVYHGKMDSQQKNDNQNAFISGEVQIMVATSAFGMGVDKKDVGLVIHFDISDSLENYVQEAGRAGRDEKITAECYVLFNEEDLSKHFILLNQSKITLPEIKQIWQAIKDFTKFKNSAQNSALEIARKAGWDDSQSDIETRVTTAISALEISGYLKRKQNIPRIFANSILAKTAQEAIEKIKLSFKLSEEQKIVAVRIMISLFSSKSRKNTNREDAESRLDYLSDRMGIDIKDIISVVNLLRDEKILADTKDLTAFIKRGEQKNRSLAISEKYRQLENFLLRIVDDEENVFHLKILNEQAEEFGCKDVSPNSIKTIINFWVIKHWIKRSSRDHDKNRLTIIRSLPANELQDKLEKRHILSKFIVSYLYEKSYISASNDNVAGLEILVEFSILEIKAEFAKANRLITVPITLDDVEDSLFYLSRIEAIKIEGGFLVVYNRLTIERLEKNNRVQYKEEDYQHLSQHYEHKIQQIHIVGEYAKKMLENYAGALKYVDDYFNLNFSSFLHKYFHGSRGAEIKRNITPAKYRELFSTLSNVQRAIIDDKNSPYIVVAAGPGSGKTKVLVHKLAALLLMEDVKHEQLLMLTFSRAAASEFKKRLIGLISNAANFIEIKTFHSYCFDLLGKVGTIELSKIILKTAIEKIKSGEVEINRITKSVLVIDEAQDMDQDEFALIQILIEKNPDMRVIAVGDDDQNIYQWRGAQSKYLAQLIERRNAKKYQLSVNYRSKSNLVQFTNQFISTIKARLKSQPIIAEQNDNGKIKIIRYHSDNLILPLVDDIITSEISGSTCILTVSNEQAVQITGLLNKLGYPVKLIQTNYGFNLYNLCEIRYFLACLQLDELTFIINDDLWQEAKRQLLGKFPASNKIEICRNLLEDFEANNPKKKYKSDLEVFIRESKYEDFIRGKGDVIYVSTIHKAKGKEFDNVFVLLDNFSCSDDEQKRQLYVAMTRAKNQLNIHLNGNYLNHLHCQELQLVENNIKYSPLDQMTIQLTHRDINLSFFAKCQRFLLSLQSGDQLIIDNFCCKNKQGDQVVKFSKHFISRLSEYEKCDFKLTTAKVNFMIFWYDETNDEELQIILPEISLVRGKNAMRIIS